jgi:hypothetical protein
MSEVAPDRSGRSSSSRWGGGTDLVLAGFLFLVATVAFRSWYSSTLADRAAFEPWYTDGVYAPRWLGTRAALWLESLLGNPLGDAFVVAGRYPLAGDMTTALLVLNGAAMAVLALLVGHVARAGRDAVGDAQPALVTTVLLAVVAASLSTVTPYDLPSLACLLAVLVLASLRPPLDLLAVPVVVVGVLTRESVLVAVAALVAAAWVDRDRRRVRPGLVVAVGVAGVAAYALPRLLDGDASAWAALSLRGNVGRLAGWLGLGLMVAAYVVWRRSWALGGHPTPPSVGRCWLVAMPYVAVALLTGYWFELRLLVPMLVAELWLRASADPAGLRGNSGAPATG